MSIRSTATEGVVALFDSTTGFAFGPVFDNGLEAESFLVWCEAEKVDPRTMNPGQAEAMYRRWQEKAS